MYSDYVDEEEIWNFLEDIRNISFLDSLDLFLRILKKVLKT